MKRIIVFLIFSLTFSTNMFATSTCTLWNETINLADNVTANCLIINNGANVNFNGYKVHVSNYVNFNGGSINLNGGSLSIGTYLFQVGGTIDINGGICDIGTFLNHLGGTININKGTLTVNSYLLQTSGIINLDDGIGTVKGYLNQAGGTIEIDNGTLEVFGNDNITGSSYFIMNDTNDNVTVHGDFIMQSNNSHSNKLTAGILDIKGDFTQKNGYSFNFKTSGTHKVIFSGDSSQTVSFDSNNSNFNILELANSNVNFATPITVSNDINNASNITFDNLSLKNSNWALNNDTTVNGNLTLDGSQTLLNLNGYKLTVKGNLNQAGGTIDIDNGTLEVFGNDNITGSSYFIMNDENDNVTVHGDFIMASNSSNSGKLTAGILDIKGDFTQKNGYSFNFKTSGTHKVILSGNSTQKVSFDSTNSGFNELILKNSNIDFISETKTLKLIDTTCNNFTLDFDNLTATYNELVCSDNITLTADQTINKDFTFKGKLIKLNGHKLTVTGNFEQPTGNVQFDNGTLLVEGDYSLSGDSNITMDNHKDNLTVKNNFYIDSNNDVNIENGVVTLYGNFSTQSQSTTIFSPNTKLLFKGNFTIYLDNTNSNTQFGNVEIYNNDIELADNEGLSEPINVDSLTDYTCLLDADNPLYYIFTTGSIKTFSTVCANKQPLTINYNDFIYGSLTLDNSTLTLADNLTVPGNLNLFNSTLIIHNSELAIGMTNMTPPQGGANGTSFNNEIPFFIQDNSTVVLDNATLSINGDYTIKEISILSMNNEDDYVMVNDNFTMASDLPQKDNLTAGTFELKGNLIQQNGDPENFVTSGTFLFKLTGESKQTIQTASSSTYFENLKLENSNISINYGSPLKVNNLYVSSSEILNTLNVEANNIYDNNGENIQGFAMKLVKNWNLVSNPVNNTIDNLAIQFKDNISILWKWSNNSWSVWTPDNASLQTDYLDKYSIDEITTIEQGEGFWIKLKDGIDNTTIKFYGDSYSLSDISTTSSTGWQLLGCGKNTGVDNLTSYFGNSIETVWRWDKKNKKWLIWSPNAFIRKLIKIYGLSFTDNNIKRGEGFWIYLN